MILKYFCACSHFCQRPRLHAAAVFAKGGEGHRFRCAISRSAGKICQMTRYRNLQTSAELVSFWLSLHHQPETASRPMTAVFWRALVTLPNIVSHRCYVCMMGFGPGRGRFFSFLFFWFPFNQKEDCEPQEQDSFCFIGFDTAKAAEDAIRRMDRRGSDANGVFAELEDVLCFSRKTP